MVGIGGDDLVLAKLDFSQFQTQIVFSSGLSLRPSPLASRIAEQRTTNASRKRALSAFVLLSGEKRFDEERSHSSCKIDSKAGVTRRRPHGL